MTSRRNAKSDPETVAAEIRQRAQDYGQAALETLAGIMHDSSSEPSRIAAAKEILDRAYGKTTAPGADEQTPAGELTIRYVNDWRERE